MPVHAAADRLAIAALKYNAQRVEGLRDIAVSGHILANRSYGRVLRWGSLVLRE